MSIDLHNETAFVVDEDALISLARHVLDAQRISPLAELSVLLVDTEEMALLHEKWMDEPGPTDVMAFEMDELRPGSGDTGRDEPEPGLLGDVVICPEVARRQAATAGHDLDAEVQLLLTHGILHLLGFDHAVPEDEAVMFGEQRRLLADWRTSHPSPA
jgi:probable rRNA maturation factor